MTNLWRRREPHHSCLTDAVSTLFAAEVTLDCRPHCPLSPHSLCPHRQQTLCSPIPPRSRARSRLLHRSFPPCPPRSFCSCPESSPHRRPYHIKPATTLRRIRLDQLQAPPRRRTLPDRSCTPAGPVERLHECSCTCAAAQSPDHTRNERLHQRSPQRRRRGPTEWQWKRRPSCAWWPIPAYRRNRRICGRNGGSAQASHGIHGSGPRRLVRLIIHRSNICWSRARATSLRLS